MQKKNLPPFKIRCSAIGQIMTNPRSKSESLSKTAMSYCETWLKEQIYNRKREFTNKYVIKGLIVEDHSIDLIARQLGYGMLFKNEQSFENDYLTGTPDIITKDTVLDAKSSWDVFTFPLFETEANSDYVWQGYGYMNLTGKTKYKVCYVLTDTPDHLIEKEMRSYAYNFGYEYDDLKYSEFLKRMTYQDIDEKDRIKVFSFEYDQKKIDQVEQRVLECREYVNYLINKL